MYVVCMYMYICLYVRALLDYASLYQYITWCHISRFIVCSIVYLAPSFVRWADNNNINILEAFVPALPQIWRERHVISYHTHSVTEFRACHGNPHHGFWGYKKWNDGNQFHFLFVCCYGRGYFFFCLVYLSLEQLICSSSYCGAGAAITIQTSTVTVIPAPFHFIFSWREWKHIKSVIH